MAGVAAEVDIGRTKNGRVKRSALLAVAALTALIGHAGERPAFEPMSEDIRALAEEYRSVRRAGFDYDPPPIPPSELWPAQ